MLHGYFSSNHIGPSRLYVRIARVFAKYGFSVWRFDCYGVGNSDGEFEEATYQSELEDHKLVLDEALKDAEPGRNVLIGHSMGTSLAVRLAIHEPKISHLVLLSPSFGKLSYPENLFTADNVRDLENAGFTVRKGLKIHKDFVNAFENTNIYELCRMLSIRVTLVYGTDDEFYSAGSIEHIASCFEDARIELIDKGDHNFIHSGSRTRLLKTVDNIARNIAT